MKSLILSVAFILGGISISSLALSAPIFFERDSSLPLVYVNLAFKTGAVSDPKGQSGLTNFMGEMLIRGTKNHTKKQIDLALDQMGANLDVEIRSEALIFRGSVLSSQLDAFLDLLKEVLTEPTFPPTEIKKLKSEIISNIQEELGHDPSLASRRFNRFLFGEHPYGNTILGSTRDISSLTREAIEAHYQRVLRESNLMLVGSGDASEHTLSQWITKMTQSLPNTPLSENDKKILAKVQTPQNPDHKRLFIVDKPDRTQTQIHVGQVGLKMTDPNFFPLYLANHAFGGHTFTAILMTEIRVKRGWSYGASSTFRFGLQPRSWHLHLFPASKDTANALTYSLQLLKDVREKGITDDQFEFAKKSLVNKAGFMYNTPKKRVENTLLEKTLELPDGFIKSYGPELTKVKLDKANSALNQFLKPDHVTISVLCTAKELKESLMKAAGVSDSEVTVVPYTTE